MHRPPGKRKNACSGQANQSLGRHEAIGFRYFSGHRYSIYKNKQKSSREDHFSALFSFLEIIGFQGCLRIHPKPSLGQFHSSQFIIEPHAHRLVSDPNLQKGVTGIQKIVQCVNQIAGSRRAKLGIASRLGRFAQTQTGKVDLRDGTAHRSTTQFEVQLVQFRQTIKVSKRVQNIILKSQIFPSRLLITNQDGTLLISFKNFGEWSVPFHTDSHAAFAGLKMTGTQPIRTKVAR